MEKLYEILKEHSECRIVLSYDNDTLRVVVSSSESGSAPGIDTDKVRTVFSVERRLAIGVNIPADLIESKGVERILTEARWAMEEIKELEKTLVD